MTKQFITLLGILASSIAYSQVGINTPDPKASLDIQSKGNTAITKALRINNSDDIEMMTVTDQGRMGIGTTNPEGHLHVNTAGSNGIISERANGTNSSSGPYVTLRRNKSTNSKVNGAVATNDYLGALVFSGNTGNGYEGDAINSNSSITSRASQNFSTNAQGSELIFRTVPNGSATAASRMTIANNGNVGVGTTSPTEKLEVNGNLKINDVTTVTDPISYPLAIDSNGVIGKSNSSTLSSVYSAYFSGASKTQPDVTSFNNGDLQIYGIQASNIVLNTLGASVLTNSNISINSSGYYQIGGHMNIAMNLPANQVLFIAITIQKSSDNGATWTSLSGIRPMIQSHYSAPANYPQVLPSAIVTLSQGDRLRLVFYRTKVGNTLQGNPVTSIVLGRGPEYGISQYGIFLNKL